MPGRHVMGLEAERLEVCSALALLGSLVAGLLELGALLTLEVYDVGVDEAPEDGPFAQVRDRIAEGCGQFSLEGGLVFVVTLAGGDFQFDRLEIDLVTIGNVNWVCHHCSFRWLGRGPSIDPRLLDA